MISLEQWAREFCQIDFHFAPPLSHPPQANGPKRYSDGYELFADHRLLGIGTVTVTVWPWSWEKKGITDGDDILPYELNFLSQNRACEFKYV